MARVKNQNTLFRNINLGKNRTSSGKHGPGDIFGGLNRASGRLHIGGARKRMKSGKFRI